jgi:hypothetical protein
VAVNPQGLELALKSFPQDSYFSARTHAMHLARTVMMYREDKIQVREFNSQVVLFECNYEDIQNKTKVLKPFYPEED